MTPIERCEFCTARPREEVAVLRWIDDERERLTLLPCMRHHQRIAKSGTRGWKHSGKLHKVGWW